MKTLRSIAHIVRADFLERSRRYSFLVILCLSVYLGYIINTGKLVLQFGGCRGIYNSAWLGALTTMAAIFFLGIFGFYLVKGSLDRDERTGVGQIMAATPMRRIDYVLGKWLSHILVLTVLLAVLAVAAVIMQFSYREDPQLNLYALLSPIFLFGLPLLSLIASLAVLFETIPFLKGGLGNVAYFFLYISGLSAVVMTTINKNGVVLFDPTGVGILVPTISQAAQKAGLGCGIGSSFTILGDQPIKTFLWNGMEWDPTLIATRFIGIAVSLVLLALAALFFSRFDPGKLGRPVRAKKTSEPKNNLFARFASWSGQITERLGIGSLFQAGIFRSNFAQMVLAELKLILKGQHWAWYGGALVLWVGGLLSKPDGMVYWLMAIMIWPVLVWSKLGTRETRYRTAQMVFSTAHPLLRLLLSTWIAGVLVSLLLGSGALINFASHGQTTQLGALLFGLVLASSCALALGVWSGTSKVFEVVYLLAWYVGILNQAPGLDFVGTTLNAVVFRQPAGIALFLAICLLLAVVGRKRQLVS